MSDETRPPAGSGASAFGALDKDMELARRRVWRRIQEGMELERRRRERRARWLGGGIAAAVAAVAVIVPVAMNLGGGGATPQPHEASLASVAAMLGAQTGPDGNVADPEQFLTDFVTEATNGSE